MKKTTGFITLICLIISFTTFSQVAGDLNTDIQSINFKKQFLNRSLDPQPTIGLNARQKIVEEFGNLSNPPSFGADIGAEIISGLFQTVGNELGIPIPNIPSDAINVIEGVGEFFGASITPLLNAGVQVKYGGYIEVNDVGNSDIKVDYPIDVIITYPEENTFGCGDEFTIQTDYVVNEKPNMLEVTPPFFEIELGPVLEDLKFEIGIGLKVSACIGIPVPLTGLCGGYKLNFDEYVKIVKEPIPLPGFLNPPPPFLNICEDAFGVDKEEADIFACSTGSSTILKTAQTILNNYNQSNSPKTNYGFSSITENKIEIEDPDFPSGVGPTLPEINGDFNKVQKSILNYSSHEAGKRLEVKGYQSEVSKIDFDLISLLAYGNIETSFSLGGGLLEFDFGDLSPTFSIDESLNFEFKPVVHITIELGAAMEYKVYDDLLGLVSSGNGTAVNLIAGQKIVAIYPEALSSPTSVSSISQLDGDFTTLTEAKYFHSTQANVLQLKSEASDFDITVFEKSFGLTETEDSPVKIQDHTFNLNGFDAIPLKDFILDPENPIINIENLTVEDIVNIGGGEREVVYKVNVNNGGDVALRNSDVTFDLSQAFSGATNLEVICVFSEDLNVNSNYNGTSETSLLSMGNTLAVGQSSMIEILVRVTPEIAEIDHVGCFEPVAYTISAFAKGTSPIGTEVITNFYQCTGERTGEDIVAKVDLGASIIESINNYTIYGWKGVVFDKAIGLSWGNVGSSETIRFENVSLKNGDTTVIVGDLHAGNEVVLQGESNVIVDYIQVANDVKITNQKSSMTETGTTSNYSDCVGIMNLVDIDVSNHYGSKKINLKEHETLDLHPGKYKEVKLQANTVLKLAAGTYDIERWVFMGDNSQVLYNTSAGAIHINIGLWQALGSENLEFRLENEGNPSDVHYNYNGNAPFKFNNSIMQGQIIAPNAEIEFALGSRLEGSCYADKVNFKTGASFIGNEHLDALNLNPKCLENKPNTIVFNRNTTPEQKEIISKATIRAFPNPVNSNLKIVSTKNMKTITVRNYLGQEMLLVNLNEKEKTITFDKLANGVYFLTVQFEKEQQTLKVIKK